MRHFAIWVGPRPELARTRGLGNSFILPEDILDFTASAFSPLVASDGSLARPVSFWTRRASAAIASPGGAVQSCPLPGAVHTINRAELLGCIYASQQDVSETNLLDSSTTLTTLRHLVAGRNPFSTANPDLSSILLDILVDRRDRGCPDLKGKK